MWAGFKRTRQEEQWGNRLSTNDGKGTWKGGWRNSMRETLAERRSWKTQAGEQKQSLAAAVRCLHYAGQNALMSPTPGYSLDVHVKAGDRDVASRRLLLLTASKPQIVCKQRLMPKTGRGCLSAHWPNPAHTFQDCSRTPGWGDTTLAQRGGEGTQ